MRSVRWSDAAIDQLDAAVDYLSDRNADAAQVLKDRIMDTVAALATRPIGRPGYCDGTYEKAVLHTAYVIVYSLVGGPDDALHVHRVFHTAQNWTGWSPNPEDEVQ
ncbi:MAG TPA: type II toxin-antitoxin system RelE/ParE family toxin [Brevundimonas sp.]|uniref:type II toxin-antitoxin system RelE/ParE family toxin n=1 Tax=Brevundimonas sp. TaxID=1871086 RepID=UPI002630AA3E|nr:type II toxin-antitoxin system RelE/ParE family toxin [Brevundimonas sp.]HRO32672.1 type II toxin-antitoxin system RelE/ParE family toxin [Brevundimonas sp.]